MKVLSQRCVDLNVKSPKLGFSRCVSRQETPIEKKKEKQSPEGVRVFSKNLTEITEKYFVGLGIFVQNPVESILRLKIFSI